MYEAMKLRLAGLCSRSEQCEADLRVKMSRAGLPSDDADRIIAFLREQRFLDDARFAGAFARDKAKFAGWGAAKIRMALAAKRIPSAVISEAIASIEPADLDRSLTAITMSKSRGLDLSLREDRAKLLRRLMSRGFPYADCVRAIKALGN